MNVQEILDKIKADQSWDTQIWVGKNYSIQDLKNDLLSLIKEKK